MARTFCVYVDLLSGRTMKREMGLVVCEVAIYKCRFKKNMSIHIFVNSRGIIMEY